MKHPQPWNRTKVRKFLKRLMRGGHRSGKTALHAAIVKWSMDRYPKGWLDF